MKTHACVINTETNGGRTRERHTHTRNKKRPASIRHRRAAERAEPIIIRMSRSYIYFIHMCVCESGEVEMAVVAAHLISNGQPKSHCQPTQHGSCCVPCPAPINNRRRRGRDAEGMRQKSDAFQAE